MTADIIPFRIERQDDRPEGYLGHCVYIIASNQNDLVKIGYTNDFLGRLKALQIGSALKLRVIRLVAGGQRVERDFHAEFGCCRAHGEWFHFVPEMMAYQSSASVDHVDTLESRRSGDLENAEILGRSLAMMGSAGEFGYDIEDVRLVLRGGDDFATVEAAERMRRRRVDTYLKRAFHELVDEMATENVDYAAELLCDAIKRYAEIVRPYYAGLQEERRREAADWVNRALNEGIAHGH